MNFSSRLKRLRLCSLRPWRSGIIATTGLALFLSGAVQLWHAGWAEWAFVLAFFAVWLLISITWSNDDYIEESNMMLAGIIDKNFEKLHARLQQVEQELQQFRDPQ